MSNFGPDRALRAKRIQYLRKMTKLSRQKFAQQTGIPYPTLQHWEDSQVHGMPETSGLRFINALALFNIDCSYEWLIHGDGEPPKVVHRNLLFNDSPNEEESTITSDRGLIQIESELNLFLSQNKHAIEFVTPDDSMEPRFIRGELVAGIRKFGEEIETLIGLDCIVLIKHGELCLRTLRKGSSPGFYHLAHTNRDTQINKPFIYDVALVSAAPVVWARRKD